MKRSVALKATRTYTSWLLTCLAWAPLWILFFALQVTCQIVYDLYRRWHHDWGCEVADFFRTFTRREWRREKSLAAHPGMYHNGK